MKLYHEQLQFLYKNCTDLSSFFENISCHKYFLSYAKNFQHDEVGPVGFEKKTICSAFGSMFELCFIDPRLVIK